MISSVSSCSQVDYSDGWCCCGGSMFHPSPGLPLSAETSVVEPCHTHLPPDLPCLSVPGHTCAYILWYACETTLAYPPSLSMCTRVGFPSLHAPLVGTNVQVPSYIPCSGVGDGILLCLVVVPWHTLSALCSVPVPTCPVSRCTLVGCPCWLQLAGTLGLWRNRTALWNSSYKRISTLPSSRNMVPFCGFILLPCCLWFCSEESDIGCWEGPQIQALDLELDGTPSQRARRFWFPLRIEAFISGPGFDRGLFFLQGIGRQLAKNKSAATKKQTLIGPWRSRVSFTALTNALGQVVEHKLLKVLTCMGR